MLHIFEACDSRSRKRKSSTARVWLWADSSAISRMLHRDLRKAFNLSDLGARDSPTAAAEAHADRDQSDQRPWSQQCKGGRRH